MAGHANTSTSRVRVVELPPGANTSDPNMYVAIEQTGTFQTSSATSFGPTAVEDFPTDLNWVPLSRVYDQSLLIDNNLLVISGTNSNQFDGYFRLYLCTNATSAQTATGNVYFLILLFGAGVPGGWYVSKQHKGSVAYRVIRVGVFALIVVVFLVGCNQGDPTGTPEPTPQPTPCPEAPGIPTVTPAPPTATPVPPIATDTPTSTETPVSCIVAIAANQQKNGYAYPAPARTERFRGDPTSPSQTYVGLPPEQVAQVFTAGWQLELTTKYDRSGNEEHVYRVSAFSTDGGVNWQPINAVWISTNDYIQPVDTTGCTSLPSENPAARNTFEGTRENLRDYGIDIGPDTALWSEAELGVVLSGVQRITNAFAAFITDNFSATVSSPGLFRRIMIPSGQGVYHDYVIFRRASRNNCQFYDTGENNVNPYDSNKLPIHIECGPSGSLWNNSLQPETVVHELGHLFDSRSDTHIRGIIDESAHIVNNCIPQAIMGNGINNGLWGRGEDGWGSVSSGGTISQFQQNPTNSPEEATADMFLNWVFRYTTGGYISGNYDEPSTWCPSEGETGSTNPGTWQGFLNIFGNNSPDEAGLPGDARFLWMEKHLTIIFSKPEFSHWR